MATSPHATSAVSAKPVGAVHPIAPSRLHAPKGRPDMVPLGTWVWLASELMFFAALFAAYFMIREFTTGNTPAGQENLFAANSHHLDKTFAAINTSILVLSSVACQLGVMAAEHGKVKRSGGPLSIFKWGMREWYILTFIMGSVFVAGQIWEYANLFSEGFFISTNAYWSAFFLATGFHGLHVFGGLLAFLFVLGRTYLARTFTHEQAVSAMVISYYWHFVDVIWIILFAVIYLLPN
ncbi:aa3-type cytochrome oxidase subunit III [Luteococcus sp. H91]|uniref:aa3-type cytochrome oxidase subunit III n=1 Tax=Luteococcus sp. H91 TaxID=3139401 RepID=UPI00406C66ED